MRRLALFLLMGWCALGGCPLGRAQQTVFNVPSADVLKRGKIYSELDLTWRADGKVGTAAPRIVVGAGKNIEVGANFGSFSTASGNISNFVPTVKWKVHSWEKAGVALLVGDNLFVPFWTTSYRAGNYVYAQVVKQVGWGRVAGGVYHFTKGVIAPRARVGGQFSVEHPLNRRLTLAADWYTGDNSLGYVTPGAVIKLSDRLTLYPAYQLGNHGISTGNHQFLVELGWNLN